jgi:hypothetical protein
MPSRICTVCEFAVCPFTHDLDAIGICSSIVRHGASRRLRVSFSRRDAAVDSKTSDGSKQ